MQVRKICLHQANKTLLKLAAGLRTAQDINKTLYDCGELLSLRKKCGWNLGLPLDIASTFAEIKSKIINCGAHGNV